MPLRRLAAVIDFPDSAGKMSIPVAVRDASASIAVSIACRRSRIHVEVEINVRILRTSKHLQDLKEREVDRSIFARVFSEE